MSIFDPLGLLSSYTITARILLQDLWRIQMGWDDELPPEYAERFDRWLKALNDVAQLRLPRRYDECDSPEPRRQLHIFVDASEKAYAAAAYWRQQHTDGRVFVTLAAAKAKVAPLRPQTIPRLELQAAVIGARLGDMIKREHQWQAEEVIYWSDSRTEIQRLNTGRTLPASSRLAKLDPVMQDGLLRVRGRINAAHAPNDVKRPFILDGRHRLTQLIVLKEHAAAGHANNERVLNDLRQRLWMLRARSTERAVARACALCEVRRAMPRVPPTADLQPEHRDPDKGRRTRTTRKLAVLPVQ